MEHLKQPKKLYFPLVVPLGLNEFVIQQTFLIGGVALRLDSLIMGLFLAFLGMVEIFATYDHQLFKFL